MDRLPLPPIQIALTMDLRVPHPLRFRFMQRVVSYDQTSPNLYLFALNFL
jgi:hypothetical protein